MAITFSALGNYGRLGNQLFQYSAMKSLSLKRGYELVLPTGCDHQMSLFKISENQESISTQHTYHEKEFNFNSNFFDSPDGCDFLGFFQSEKYFIDYAKQIRKSLQFKDIRIDSYAQGYLNKLREKYNKKIVALHIRRGDNVPSSLVTQSKTKGVFRPDKEKYHPLLSNTYIQESMAQFNDVVFLVFSDTKKDIDWCRENIAAENIEFSEGHPDIIDFALQRNCDHNIIANSSFSWWAAWLNNNSNKKIIAPSRWFGEAYDHFDLSDLYPKEWIVI